MSTLGRLGKRGGIAGGFAGGFAGGGFFGFDAFPGSIGIIIGAGFGPGMGPWVLLLARSG